MALATGTHLGCYEVVAPIGAGGMGEVYQAHDTKLGRDVAIKVLPEAFAHDPERLSRFQREAKMLASLNHPNIATIHGLEQSGYTSYLVMELVSGETLAERVKAGPLGIEEALKIAVQIAEALEAAHEKSIIHRDLKPANVKLTPEGKVKVLDFGLAKAFVGDTSTEDMGNSPTLSMAATMQGVILGTAAYMSPEQARGRAVDKRTDIWAFGCVLYELLTGRQAFHAESTTEILAAVLKEEPNWQALPASTPVKIRDLLGRCLQKDKTLRLRDAGDAGIEIHAALTAPHSESSGIAVPGKVISALSWRTLIFTLFGALMLGGLVTGIAVWNLKPSPAPSTLTVSRTAINLPPGQQLAGLDGGPAVSLSPDGSHLAYVARQNGTQQLYLRAMDSLESKPIPDTEGAVNPFFSPDGQWLGFFSTGKLKKVSLNGGAAITLGDAASPNGANWGSNGMIAFALTINSVLVQVPEAGGPTQPLTHFVRGEVTHRWPEFLPGGKSVLFAAGTNGINFSNAQIAVHSVGTGERRNLLPGTQPRYAPSGQLVYSQGGNLMAVPFDPQLLAVTGPAVPVVEGVLQSTIYGDAHYSLSVTGSLVYVPGGVESAQRKLVWVSRNGTEQPLAAPAHPYLNPRLSPDGLRVAVTIEEEEDQIWLYEPARETLTRFTFEGSLNNPSVWTPDGKWIAFSSNRQGVQNIFRQPADGSGSAERLTTGDYAQIPMSWSPDGKLLSFFEVNPTTGYDLWVQRMDGPATSSGQAPSTGSGQARNAQLFLRTPFNESVPKFSPDGRWLAYVSDESGRYEIYVQPYPGPGGKLQISTEGGTEPVWNRSRRELFYRNGGKMMAVDIATQPNFAAGKPRMLFEGKYQPSPGTAPNYDVSPDGQRFLMLKPVEQAQSAPTQINVVLNWFEELKRRVPVGTK